MSSTLRSGPEFVCPFCRRAFSVGYGENGDACSLLHAMPMCPTFERHDPVTFLQLVNAIGPAELWAASKVPKPWEQ